MFAQQLIQASIEWVTRGLPHGCSGFKQYAVSFCRSTIARRAAFVGGEPEIAIDMAAPASRSVYLLFTSSARFSFIERRWIRSNMVGLSGKWIGYGREYLVGTPKCTWA
jgi:hypothetical protein